MKQKPGRPLLERLYQEEIIGDTVPCSAGYHQAVEKSGKLRDRLESRLPEKQTDLLDEYDFSVEDAHQFHLQHTFAAGVSFGVRLMLEALREDEVEMK